MLSSRLALLVLAFMMIPPSSASPTFAAPCFIIICFVELEAAPPPPPLPLPALPPFRCFAVRGPPPLVLAATLDAVDELAVAPPPTKPELALVAAVLALSISLA